MKRKIIYCRSVNLKMTEEQFESMQNIRRITGITVSQLLRDNLKFLELYYSKEEK